VDASGYLLYVRPHRVKLRLYGTNGSEVTAYQDSAGQSATLVSGSAKRRLRGRRKWLRPRADHDRGSNRRSMRSISAAGHWIGNLCERVPKRFRQSEYHVVNGQSRAGYGAVVRRFAYWERGVTMFEVLLVASIGRDLHHRGLHDVAFGPGSREPRDNLAVARHDP